MKNYIDIIPSLVTCFNNSPDSYWRYYVKVSHDPYQSLVVRRRDNDNKTIYINSLKEGDEILSYDKKEVHWVKFGPRFEGSYFFTNLAKYIVELCNKTKDCQVPTKDFVSLPCNEYSQYLLVKENGFMFYLNMYGKFEPFLGVLEDSMERTYSGSHFLMPIPNALVSFLIQELKMKVL